MLFSTTRDLNCSFSWFLDVVMSMEPGIAAKNVYASVAVSPAPVCFHSHMQNQSLCTDLHLLTDETSRENDAAEAKITANL